MCVPFVRQLLCITAPPNPDLSHGQEGKVASPRWGEAAAEPQEPEGDGNVIPERCPNPAAATQDTP